MKRPTISALIATAGCCLFLIALAAQGAGPSDPQDEASYKASMDVAADVQDDLRDALRAKDALKAAASATKLEALMAQTERYWAKKNAADGIRLAKASRAFAGQVASAAEAGQWADADETSVKLSGSCKACHDLHLEER